MIYMYTGTSSVVSYDTVHYLTQQLPWAGARAVGRACVAKALLVPTCVVAIGAILVDTNAPTSTICAVPVSSVLHLLSLLFLIVVPSHIAGALVG
jgi:hypothetical protein